MVIGYGLPLREQRTADPSADRGREPRATVPSKVAAALGPRHSEGVNDVSARLTRPRDDRWIAGVCAGLGRRFGMSSGVVRLIFVISCLLPGPQILIYLVLWALMPSE